MTASTIDARSIVKENEQSGHFASVTKANKALILIADVDAITRHVYRIDDSPVWLVSEPLYHEDVISDSVIIDAPLSDANFQSSRRMTEGPGLYRCAYEIVLFDETVDDELGVQTKWVVIEVVVEGVP